ncbi:MAG: hypothetical protein KDJ99_16485 [Candidatus Competibacteraceae bacterium]|nr:hypothetical protein [Candidatus Competibacteraceae bacterium]
MTDNYEPTGDTNDAEQVPADSEEQAIQNRREFLIGLGKWSRAVIAGAVVGAGAMAVQKPAQAGWLNRRGGGGGGWINGGGSWANRRGGWGGSWINAR